MIEPLRLSCGALLAADPAGGPRSFALGFWFPLGSRHETAAERGFVHFVEHMAFKGTVRRSALSLSREAERVGGYLNAFTDRDYFCLHCHVPASSWKLAVDLLSDMAFSSLFDVDDFERERSVIASEIRSAEDDPEERSNDAFLAAIWPDDALSLKIAGSPEDVARIARDELFGFYRAMILPENLLVSAAGPVELNELARELELKLQMSRGLPAADGIASPAVLTATPPLDQRRPHTPRFRAARDYRCADMEQVHYYIGMQIEPPFSERDYYTLSALNGALGESSSSRLFQALREREGLCYSVYSAFSMERSECLWLAAAGVSPDKLLRLAECLDRELDLARDKGLVAEECDEALSRLRGSFELALEDQEYRMRRLARQLLFSGRALDEGETRELLSRLGPADLSAMTERLFAGERARFAYGKKNPTAARALGLRRVSGRFRAVA